MPRSANRTANSPTKSEPARLQVFISYATEDVDLANALSDGLRKAFGAILKTSLAAEYKLGVSWREQIEDGLNCSDVLLVVATGRHKLSHSFTGFEVGYFRSAIQHKPRMIHFDSERLIIPVAVFNAIPDTVADVQGVEHIDALMVNQASLRDQQTFLRHAKFDQPENPLLKIFARIQEIVQTSISFTPGELKVVGEQIVEGSQRFHERLFSEFRNRVCTERFPERKIVVRLAATGERINNDPLANATLEFVGGSFDIFGLTPERGEVTWERFISSIPNRGATNLAGTWTDIITSLVTAARREDFRENRRLLTSYDQSRFFRMFVARSVLYYSGITELHIYIVEVKSRDYGDPITTMLLKAIQVGLHYRFMFLEPTSEFSPIAFDVIPPTPELRERASELIQELDYILWMSKDSGLDKPQSILAIYGDDLKRGDIQAKYEVWDGQKAALYDAVHLLLGASNNAELKASKEEFLHILTTFCDSTKELNREYVAKVLRALEDAVVRSDPLPHMDRAGPALSLVHAAE